jgi:hypothetical protein
MDPRLGRRVPTRRDTMVIPHRQRFPYGNDVAATGRVGRARASVRGRVGHFVERPFGRCAARVSGPAEAGTSSGSAIASASARNSSERESRANAAAQVMPSVTLRVERLTDRSSTLNESHFSV